MCESTDHSWLRPSGQCSRSLHHTGSRGEYRRRCYTALRRVDSVLGSAESSSDRLQESLEIIT